MTNKSSYKEFAASFRAATIQDLVETFNDAVGKTAWTDARAYRDQALIDEFRHRGIDISAIACDDSISFVERVKYNEKENKLETLK